MNDVATCSCTCHRNQSDRLMNDYQWVAVANFFSTWPADISFESLIAHLKRDDWEHEDLVVWKPFADYSLNELADIIQSRHDTLVLTFIPRFD